MRILIVEDEIITSMWLEAVFVRMEHQVIAKVVSGDAAIERALTDQPDLITMDINLVGQMNGIEAARKIQETLNIPIIFMTGYVDSHYQEAAKGIYSPAFLHKPVEMEVLKKVIETHFSS